MFNIRFVLFTPVIRLYKFLISQQPPLVKGLTLLHAKLWINVP